MDDIFIKNSSIKKITGKTIISFLTTFLLCAILVSISIFNRMKVERLVMERLIIEKTVKTNDVLSGMMYKMQTLSAFVLKSREAELNFEQIAEILVSESVILNILMAPDGIVTDVYPKEGNEAVLGMNLLGEGVGNKEAIIARETGQLVLGGPFISVQGVQILVGRLPVFVKKADGRDEFWGLVSISLKYPQILDKIGLNELQLYGFEYEICRLNPDNGEKEVIADSGYEKDDDVRYIEQHVSVQNADWYFRILPVRTWYEYPDSWLLLSLSLLISALLAFVVQNNSKLKVLKSSYKKLSFIDLLTGIYNRRSFMELAVTKIEKGEFEKGSSFIIMCDIDYFKKINDVYGHLAGDCVLRDFALRIKEVIRKDDLFSRYGGEEFIIFVGDMDKQSVIDFTENLRRKVMDRPFKFKEAELDVTASFGISYVDSGKNIDEFIDFADKALYIAKNEGRNRVVFYEIENSNEDKGE